jgi:hypothetical protein
MTTFVPRQPVRAHIMRALGLELGTVDESTVVVRKPETVPVPSLGPKYDGNQDSELQANTFRL